MQARREREKFIIHRDKKQTPHARMAKKCLFSFFLSAAKKHKEMNEEVRKLAHTHWLTIAQMLAKNDRNDEIN